MQLYWIKCQGEVWCQLDTVNLAHSHFDGMEGVYIIWHGGAKPATVYVGQGSIRKRLTFHRTNPKIQPYRALGLYVTWARVASQDQNGVERFLSEKLKPLVGEEFPDVNPIEVNLPW